MNDKRTIHIKHTPEVENSKPPNKAPALPHRQLCPRCEVLTRVQGLEKEAMFFAHTDCLQFPTSEVNGFAYRVLELLKQYPVWKP